jgi:hypothetical protein
VFLLVSRSRPKEPGRSLHLGRRQGSNEGSEVEFPFRRSELGKGDFARSIVIDAPKPKETTAEPAAAPSTAHKTGSRAPVLPFSLKRDEEPPVAAPPLKKEERAPVVSVSQKIEAPPEPPPAPKVVEPPARPVEVNLPEPPWRARLGESAACPASAAG